MSDQGWTIALTVLTVTIFCVNVAMLVIMTYLYDSYLELSADYHAIKKNVHHWMKENCPDGWQACLTNQLASTRR